MACCGRAEYPNSERFHLHYADLTDFGSLCAVLRLVPAFALKPQFSTLRVNPSCISMARYAADIVNLTALLHKQMSCLHSNC